MIDVNRDVMQVELVINSVVDAEKVSFGVEIKNWTSHYLELFLNFTDPLKISKGFPQDEIVCRIINGKLFRAAESELYLMSNRTMVYSVLPP